MTIKTREKVITPAAARAMLRTSEELGAKNRKVSNNHVELYANDIRSGNWKLNGDAIKLDEDGRILDGQHRLRACVLANMPMRTMVMTGVSKDAFDTLDCGRARTTSQVLQMAEVKYNSLIACIIRGAAEIRTVGHTDMKEKRLSNIAALEEYKANSEIYGKAAAVGTSAVGETHAMTQKMAGSVYFYLVHDLQQDPEKVEKFIREITSFDSSASPVLDKLRKWNLANRMQKISDRTRLGYLILTWNAWVTGAAKAPRFSEGSIEEMPTFVTLK